MSAVRIGVLARYLLRHGGEGSGFRHTGRRAAASLGWRPAPRQPRACASGVDEGIASASVLLALLPRARPPIARNGTPVKPRRLDGTRVSHSAGMRYAPPRRNSSSVRV